MVRWRRPVLDVVSARLDGRRVAARSLVIYPLPDRVRLIALPAGSGCILEAAGPEGGGWREWRLLSARGEVVQSEGLPHGGPAGGFVRVVPVGGFPAVVYQVPSGGDLLTYFTLSAATCADLSGRLSGRLAADPELLARMDAARRAVVVHALGRTRPKGAGQILAVETGDEVATRSRLDALARLRFPGPILARVVRPGVTVRDVDHIGRMWAHLSAAQAGRAVQLLADLVRFRPPGPLADRARLALGRGRDPRAVRFLESEPENPADDAETLRWRILALSAAGRPLLGERLARLLVHQGTGVFFAALANVFAVRDGAAVAAVKALAGRLEGDRRAAVLFYLRGSSK